MSLKDCASGSVILGWNLNPVSLTVTHPLQQVMMKIKWPWRKKVTTEVLTTTKWSLGSFVQLWVVKSSIHFPPVEGLPTVCWKQLFSLEISQILHRGFAVIIFTANSNRNGWLVF